MVGAVDKGHKADWGETSRDYAAHRPGPPASFYEKLGERGIGVEGQSVLDLGTGTGVMARELARRGCRVAASDISSGQVDMAAELAAQACLDIDFKTGVASQIDWPDNSFDVVTALQCWWYFDHPKAIAEINRVLKPGGRLAVCSFSFLPKEDKIVAASEAMVLKHNPEWSGAGWDGTVPIFGDTMPDEKYLVGKFVYDEAIPFTRESWRGRMRALRGIGASLSVDAVEAFDREHEVLLNDIAGANFTILHRIDAHIYKFE